ncbi:molecular chaperone Hsp33 [Fistulifera solaris]|uniref:Molecular chaperone Hsp33 n=1 Tax=Fistulifera solaris TaxID=1519565 RepID=A0A1Z5J804_FISSO|nr:molecular chaperone Hsp33 [Fistulifera solaris]|eukprot:GAX10042.1 molecular chaperone Hsp33 [Fistulifera solaris]
MSPFSQLNRNWKTFMMYVVLTVYRPQLFQARAAFSHKHVAPFRSRSARAMGTSAETTDPLEVYRNKNNNRDQIFSAISGDGGIKVTVATIRNVINDASMQHTMTFVPTDALGRAMTCGLLMANGMQEEQTVQITMKGDGPLRGVVAIATGSGTVRGYVGSPMLGEMSLPEAVGKGSVQVVKNHPDWPRPYNGITAIRHGDIDRDVGIYLAESEQRSCALAAAVSVKGILCTSAGGYLIEQLPGVEPDVVKQVEKNLAQLVEMDGTGNLPTGLLLQGQTPVDIAATILDGLDMKPLQQMEPVLVCQCTEDRLMRSLRLLPREEVEDILAKEQQIEARCQFCGKVYRLGKEEIEERLQNATGEPSKS